MIPLKSVTLKSEILLLLSLNRCLTVTVPSDAVEGAKQAALYQIVLLSKREYLGPAP
mgnify:CR=1 FL=1